MVEYSEDKKKAYYNGLTFTRDSRTGYYLNSTSRTRLHRCVWEKLKGKIPDGYHVHHIDKDKRNNNISNLKLMLATIHGKHHGAELTEEQREWFRNNLEVNARPKAIEWHKSEKGRKWHRKQYKEIKDKLHQKQTKSCDYCGILYEAPLGKRARFCSNKCKSAWRRKEGLDNEQKICGCCGKEYTDNKYTKSTVCSKSCSMSLYPRRR